MLPIVALFKGFYGVELDRGDAISSAAFFGACQRKEREEAYISKLLDSFLMLSVWDFGGQHLYRHAQRLFLRPYSVCLLVVDALSDMGKQELEEVGYWKSFADGKMVIPVVTRCDLLPKKLLIRTIVIKSVSF